MTDIVLINATPSSGNSDAKWDLEIVNDNKSGGYGNYPKAHLSQGQKDVKFVIQIQDAKGWSFAKDSAALWVSDKGQDPTAPMWVNTEIPKASIKTMHKGQQLVFVDNNSSAGDLNYTLNFVKGANTTSTLDPIIENGGPGLDSAVIILGGLLLLAVAGGLAMLALRNRQRGSG